MYWLYQTLFCAWIVNSVNKAVSVGQEHSVSFSSLEACTLEMEAYTFKDLLYTILHSVFIEAHRLRLGDHWSFWLTSVFPKPGFQTRFLW